MLTLRHVDSFNLICSAAKLHQALYTPTGWAAFANKTMYPYWSGLVVASNISLLLATHSLSEPTTLPTRDETALNPLQVYTFQAIAYGDSIDQDDVTTKTIFDEFVRVSQEVSTFCNSTSPE